MARATIAIAALVVSFAGPAPAAAQAPAIRLDSALTLWRQRRFFELRDVVAKAGSSETTTDVVARAMVDAAFNRPAESNAGIETAIARGGVDDTLAAALRLLQVSNALRLHRYADAAAAARAGLAMRVTAQDAAAKHDLENMLRLASAVSDVPAQTVERASPITIPIADGRIPVTIGDSSRSYVFDTGANISTIMRSEAAALGMRIRAAGIDVGSSTDKRVTADLAVADRLAIGGFVYRNVVFLVLDDELLSFPGGFRIPGIIGFPVIEAMGEVHVRRGNELFVPIEQSAGADVNLAFNGYSPLTTVSWNGRGLICRLDTGANTTQLYEPVFRRFRGDIERMGRRDTLRTGGAGGMRALPAYSLSDVRLGVGDTSVTLPRVFVHTSRITRTPEENYLDCNLGHDVLDAFSEYSIDFRRMNFRLR